jgi:hypothetical protein
MATMSSLSDDGYEEDEESNVSKINLGVCWGHCVLKWGFTRTFPENQDATLK